MKKYHVITFYEVPYGEQVPNTVWWWFCYEGHITHAKTDYEYVYNV